jgi:hypothetical protein
VKSIKDDILSWSQDVIEKPNKHLGNFPTCPYANGCRTQNQFTIEEVHDAKQLLPTVVDWASKLKRTRYRIAIIGCSDLSITATELDASIEALNFVYMPKDVYLIASQKLKKVGYYKYWEADYYKETVEHRQQLKRRIDMRGMKKTAKKVNGKLNSAIKKVKKTKKKKKK